MNKEHDIDRPIFIVSCARSGSTMFHYLLGGHPDLAWFSNITTRLPMLPQLATLSRFYPIRKLYKLPKIMEYMIPKPFEGNKFFDRCNLGGNYTTKYMGANEAAIEDTECLKRYIQDHLKYHRRPRFMNKNIGNLLRVEYLNSVFPNAKFVHLVRDPVATVASLLNWKLPTANKDWGKRNLSEIDKELAMLSFDKAVDRWIASNKQIMKSLSKIEKKWISISYEVLTRSPQGVMDKVLSYCELEWTDHYRRFVDRFRIGNMNEKYLGQFTEGQIIEIRKKTQELSNKMGI